jgi:hypothetical protein
MTAAAERASPVRQPAAYWLILILIVVHLIPIWGVFPYRAFTEGGAELQIFSVALGFYTLIAIVGLWLAAPWAPWATLVVVAFATALDLFAWSTGYLGPYVAASLVLLAIATLILFRQARPTGPRVVVYHRILHLFVLAGAGWVAFWGLALPAASDIALPFTVPPLHARFISAIYLSGFAYMLLALFARHWSEIRVVSIVLAVWTVMLGIVTVINLPAFDWSLEPVWFWFFAYTSFPIVGWYIVWSQRNDVSAADGPPLASALRAWLSLQGLVATVLALALFEAPNTMATLWPWALPPVVGQLYSAPLLAFGLGSFYAAQQHGWREARMVVVCSLVLAAAVLVGSYLHRGLFDRATVSAWLWFAGFAIVGLLNLLFLVAPSLRTKAKA